MAIERQWKFCQEINPLKIIVRMIYGQFFQICRKDAIFIFKLIKRVEKDGNLIFPITFNILFSFCIIFLKYIRMLSQHF